MACRESSGSGMRWMSVLWVRSGAAWIASDRSGSRGTHRRAGRRAAGRDPRTRLRGTGRGTRAGGRRLVDVAAPRARSRCRALDELLELRQVGLDLPVVRRRALSPTFSTTPSGSKSIWTVTRVCVSSSRWKVTTPACFGPVERRPGDPLVRVLLGDLGVELPRHAADSVTQCVCVSSSLADLARTPLHELRERLELGPLVVGGPDGDVDVDGLHNLAHVRFPSSRCSPSATPTG